MGIFDWFRRQPIVAAVDVNDRDPGNDASVATAASVDIDVSGTFSNSNPTYRGDLRGFDYEKLLRDKQLWQNYVSLCKLANYYVDEDPLFRGIIKEVYTPFSCAAGWQLVGGDERIQERYQKYYDDIHLGDFEYSVFFQYWLYGNVVVYLMPNGRLITLPFNMTRIGNVVVNGEPVVEYHCRAVKDEYVRTYGELALKPDIRDELLEERLKGLPPEVTTGIYEGYEWVQLNPRHTFVLQDTKEDWQRYATPLVASCLKAFRKKELISRWEDAQLNLGIHAFLHVQYGDPNNEVLPEKEALMLIGQTFKTAMTKNGLAVTNNWAEAKFLQPDLDSLFSDDKYKSVNSDILDAGGISGIIVSGRAEDGSTFATAQVSMQTAAMRISRVKDQFCAMMDRINVRINDMLNIMPHAKPGNIPLFRFPPTDLTGDANFLKTCETLFAKGMLSNETYLSAYKFDFQQEVKRKKREASNGIAELFMPTKDRLAQEQAEDVAKNETTDQSTTVTVERSTETEEETVRGRPTMDNTERHSDPSKSMTGRQPKGSRPEGSVEQNVT